MAFTFVIGLILWIEGRSLVKVSRYGTKWHLAGSLIVTIGGLTMYSVSLIVAYKISFLNQGVL